MKFEILEEEPECVVCPVRDLCHTPAGETIYVTKEIYHRSGCDGAAFDVMEIVEGGGR